MEIIDSLWPGTLHGRLKSWIIFICASRRILRQVGQKFGGGTQSIFRKSMSSEVISNSPSQCLCSPFHLQARLCGTSLSRILSMSASDFGVWDFIIFFTYFSFLKIIKTGLCLFGGKLFKKRAGLFNASGHPFFIGTIDAINGRSGNARYAITVILVKQIFNIL